MKRILIVDDKEENVYYLSALLTSSGFTVDSARHGAEALVKARLAMPDLIISDLLMPIMDGYTLLRLWKADAKLRSIPFIVYTATYTEPEDERLALSLGADAFILKPAEPDDFLARIREVQTNAAARIPTPAKHPAGDEKELLKVYSETLIRKLEEKTLQLEESNRALQRDIADRKELEAELAVREQRLNAFFTNAPAGLVLLDKELRYVQLNETVAQINGIAIKDHLGKTIREVLPSLAPVAEPLLKKVLETGQPMSNIEISGETPSQPGVTRHWMESFFPIIGKNGSPEGVGVILVEITERKRAEEELHWKTAFLEAQVDSSPDGVLVVDSRGKKILQNQRLNDLWKIPSDIASSNDDRKQVEFVASRTNNPEQFTAKIAYLYSHPNEVSRDEIELVDGTILDRYSSPVRNKAGNYYGRIWAFRDITQQRKLETQFRQSQKMEAFGQLAGGVAHDFNNILAIIQLQAGLLVESKQNFTPEQLNIAADIVKAAERGANLTRQLLLFSRRQTMQPQNLKLKEVVDNITRMLVRTLGEHIQLQFKFSDEPLYIHADPGMIDQILLNLTVNSRDAMPKGGRILIETSAAEFDEVAATQTPQARPGSFVCLSVTDSGCGIPPEILPRIFEPFFTTKEVGKGTGLGLATVFGIVQQHKGWINVYSEVGRGTTFRIYLPRMVYTSDTKFLRLSQASIRGGTETILLVEDESRLRASEITALTRLGYRVLEASTGHEALEIWKKYRDEIHLLLTDLIMPGGMTGRELAAQLLEQNPKLKVIYASGHSADVTDKDFRLEDGVNFLSKPFEVRDLAQTLRNCLDKVGG